MLADFSIWTLDDPAMHDDMQLVRETLDERGLEYTMNRMSTSVEGSLTQISESIEACRQKLAVKHNRLLIQITFDDDRSK
ncbi:hypothetical protein LF1_36370 [Rubripirellula obstinata]|uniref:Thiamine-binding protein domain-containing protein n=1 Tax=Rubripirellula obstinata TaxID=406547 RepID=A0A5B1CNZ8_9BACT|nr:thiamine-binding protein [Rubripirellula obstinata]KAA1261093.1 hypothetical protein LF1_36370 [Rubripirellula obstinata]